MSDRAVWVALGSNLGDRQQVLEQAVERLGAAGWTIECCSHLYETVPEHGKDEPPYLNGVLRALCSDEPRALLDTLHEVERALGRTRGPTPEPRTCDLDLLAVGDLVLSEEGIVLPHPRLGSRSFVLVPLCEIDPRWQLPGTTETAASLLSALPYQVGEVRMHSLLARPDDSEAVTYAWRSPRGGRVGA